MPDTEDGSDGHRFCARCGTERTVGASSCENGGKSFVNVPGSQGMQTEPTRTQVGSVSRSPVSTSTSQSSRRRGRWWVVGTVLAVFVGATIVIFVFLFRDVTTYLHPPRVLSRLTVHRQLAPPAPRLLQRPHHCNCCEPAHQRRRPLRSVDDHLCTTSREWKRMVIYRFRRKQVRSERVRLFADRGRCHRQQRSCWILLYDHRTQCV